MARKRSNEKPATVREVREWAKNEGVVVGQRGRIASSVRDAFTKATGRSIA